MTPAVAVWQVFELVGMLTRNRPSPSDEIMEAVEKYKAERYAEQLRSQHPGARVITYNPAAEIACFESDKLTP